MEDEQQAPALATVFPAPPPFWKSFTPENIEQVEKLRKSQTQSSKSFDPSIELPIQILDLPPELRFFQPPDQPHDGRYRSFGALLDLSIPLPSLEDQGIDRLYTPPASPGKDQPGKHFDRAFILKKLAKSLLLNFVELMGILSINAEHAQEKIDDLNTMFMNFHHLLNEYRPHQARESLILMMQDQLDKSREETKGIRDMKAKVESILEGLSQAKLAEPKNENEDEVTEDMEGRDKWDELSREFD